MFESTELLLLWIFCTYLLATATVGIINSLKKTNYELHTKLVKRLDEIVHRVEVVEDNSMFYWYDRDNKKFLAQGRTTEELIDVIKQRFPDHIFYFEKSNHLICAKHGWKPEPVRLSTNS